MIDLKRNKRNVAAFYELMFNDCKLREAVETYAGRNIFSTTRMSATAKRLSSPISKRWPPNIRTKGSRSSAPSRTVQRPSAPTCEQPNPRCGQIPQPRARI